MLNDQDINKLLSVLASKKDLGEVGEKINYLQDSMKDLHGSIDTIVKSLSDLKEEYTAISLQMDRYDGWIHNIADKVGIVLKS